jgi:hypothetical protein
VQIDKTEILQLLLSHGDDTRVQQAEVQLPATVDTDEHAGILSALGLDPQEIVARRSGGSQGEPGGPLTG